LGIFNRNVQDTYIDTTAYNNIVNNYQEKLQKSVQNGKAQSNDLIGVLDIDGGNPKSKKTTTTFQNTVLAKKASLHEFSQALIIQAIIRTRCNQVRPYCHPAGYTSHGIGYQIVRRDKDTMTKSDLDKAHKYEQFLYHTGDPDNPKFKYNGNRDLFPEFINKMIIDRYVYDQRNIERIYKSRTSDKLDHFNAVDAGTVVIDNRPRSLDEPRKFAQYIRSKRTATWDEKHMTFISADAQTDANLQGYGFSPTEAAKEHINYFMQTEQFNARFFSQGGMTRGILVVNTGTDANQSQYSLNALQRQWSSQLGGLNNAWRIPVAVAQDAKFVNMTQNSKDMEFHEWLNFLTNLITADFTINPAEINMPNKGGTTSRGSNSINEGSSMKETMQNSQQKGLEPLLNELEDMVNDYLMPYIDKDFLFRFTLGDSKSALEKQKEIEAMGNNGLTFAEARKMNGKGLLTGDYKWLNDAPMNAVAVQWANLQAKDDPESQYTLQHSKDNTNFDGTSGMSKPSKDKDSKVETDNPDNPDNPDNSVDESNQSSE